MGVFSTILISNIYSDKNSGDVSPSKNVDLFLDREIIDKSIAFGSDQSTNLFTSNQILNSNIISDFDKDVLRNYEKKEYANYFYCL